MQRRHAFARGLPPRKRCAVGHWSDSFWLASRSALIHMSMGLVWPMARRRDFGMTRLRYPRRSDERANLTDASRKGRPEPSAASCADIWHRKGSGDGPQPNDSMLVEQAVRQRAHESRERLEPLGRPAREFGAASALSIGHLPGSACGLLRSSASWLSSRCAPRRRTICSLSRPWEPEPQMPPPFRTA